MSRNNYRFSSMVVLKTVTLVKTLKGKKRD
jgi:hypothetical protein